MQQLSIQDVNSAIMHGLFTNEQLEGVNRGGSQQKIAIQ
jgi:hypothetical protein